MLAPTEDLAQHMAKEIEIFNTSRRTVEQEITQEALTQIEDGPLIGSVLVKEAQ